MVALTAEDDSAIVQRLLANGFDGHLLKPVDETALQEMLAAWLGEKPAEAPDDESALTQDPEFQALIDNYVSGLGRYIEALNHAMDQKDWETLRSLAHQLKGSGGSFGFEAISVTARALESAIKAGDMQAIPEKYDMLIHEIGLVCSQSVDSSLGLLG